MVISDKNLTGNIFKYIEIDNLNGLVKWLQINYKKDNLILEKIEGSFVIYYDENRDVPPLFYVDKNYLVVCEDALSKTDKDLFESPWQWVPKTFDVERPDEKKILNFIKVTYS